MERRLGRTPARTAGALGVLATLCILPSAASADPGAVAPPGSASAAALAVGDLLAVSRTGATASHDTGEAHAGVVELNGRPVLGTGGTQHGTGATHGSLLDTGATPLGRVQVAPWDASVEDANGRRTARGRASALDLYVIDEDTVSVNVLTTTSEATHEDGHSTGRASSDGAHVSALGGAVDVVVLHSDSSSDGTGSSYLVGLNGTGIGNDEQLGSVCSLDVPDVAAVGCLAVSGGDAGGGTTSGSSDVATADVVPVPPARTVVLGTKTAAGPGTSVKGTGSRGGTTGPSADGSRATAGGLPMTGAPLTTLAALGSLALVAGSWVRTLRRPRAGEA